MTDTIPTRPRVFLDLQSGPEFFGRIVIELFSDKAPKTCENFRAICTSAHAPSPDNPAQALTYKGSPFHRIIDEFMLQGGDITAGNGTGGASIYGGDFEDENIGWREIDSAGLVCMANRGKGTNSSQFFITLAPCEHLNAKHTVIGHVVKGMEVCERMAKLPVDGKDRTLSKVLVSYCGELQPRSMQHPPAQMPQMPQMPIKAPSGAYRHAWKTKGSKAERTRSISRSSRSQGTSQSPSRRHWSYERSASPRRRRSDTGLDETRRGRTPTRSVSPNHHSSQSSQNKHRYCKRNSPPSRSRSPKRSPSPHFRRRHPDRDRSPRSTRNQRRGYGRQDGQSFNSDIRQDRAKNRSADNDHGKYSNGRLGDIDDDEPPTGIKFKGRGSMKYRER